MATSPSIEKITLQGKHVRLEPLDEERHRNGIAAAIDDGELWKLPVTVVPHPDDLGGFFADAEQAFSEGRELPFATIDVASGKVAGSTRFRMIEAGNRRAEIGFTFVARSWQRTHVNTEAKLLMLRHAFETWELNRVELITDLLNQRSQAAIQRIGATREGLLRSHMVMRDGRIRDSVLFSIIKPEWPAAKLDLEQRLS
jgi:N-acetyltransferase